MMFYEEYLSGVQVGVQQLVVTSQDDRKMTAQEAMDLWSAKAKRMRDELKGLIFFCGNGAGAF